MALRFWLGSTTLALGGLLTAPAATAAAPLPKLTTATVVGDRVTLAFSGAIRSGNGSWTVVANGKPVKPSRVVFAAKRVQLVLPTALYGDDTIRVVGRSLRARSGARLRVVDTTPVNRSIPGCTQELGTVVPGAWNEGPTDWGTFLPSSKFRILSAEVDFADAPTRNPFDRPLRLDAVDSWVRTLSYGRSTVQYELLPGIVRMAKNYTSYAYSGPWGGRKPFFQDLVQRLDGEVDFGRFDAVFVSSAFPPFKPGVQREVPQPAILAPPGTGVTADGKELRHFGQMSDPVSAFQSLMTLAGLPALQYQFVGGWDPMSAHSRLGLLAWHRYKLGWLDPTQIRCLGTAPIEVTLTPTWSTGGTKMVVAATSGTTAIVVENRQNAGLDAGLCKRGLLAYEVRTEGDVHVSIVAADATSQPDCTFLARAPHDVQPGDSVRLSEAMSVQVLSVDPDGSYRVRVTR